MSNPPLVSAIIPSYNSARYAVQAVESVLAQSYAPVELIVIDDGSTDDTAARLAPYLNRLRYIRQTNGGVARARNRGIEEAHGDLIAFLDADDVWLPEKLAKQVQALAAHPEAALVHTDIYRLQEPRGERTYVRRHRDRFQGHCYKEFFWGHLVTPSTVLVRRSCLDHVGGFDEAIRAASTEDQDLWMRMARHYLFHLVDEPLVLYRHHAQNSSLNSRTMVQNEYYVLEKALRNDPELWQLIGAPSVRQRMSGLAFQSAYAAAEAGDMPAARTYCLACLRYDPHNWNARAFWASLYLPTGLRQNLRRLKQLASRIIRGSSVATQS